MKMMIRGVTLEDVSVEEATQIIGKTRVSEKTYNVKDEEIRAKRHYTKRKTKTKVWWTEKEIHYILSNPGMKPKQLHEEINRHTVMAISIMSSAIRTGKYNSAGKYVKEIVSAFYNKGMSPNRQIDSIITRA